VLAPVGDDAPWVGAQGTPLWTSNSGDMRVIAGVNQFGDVVVLRRDGDTWRGSRLDIAGLSQLESFDVVSVLTHTDAQQITHVFVVSEQGTYLALVQGDHAARVPADRLDTA